MTITKDKDVLTTARASEWFKGFLITIRAILPTWAKAYGKEQEWKHAAGSPERVEVCHSLWLCTSQTETCRWISRKGQSLPFSWETAYRSNGNMPLDLQKGSKFTVLIRDPYKQNTESMPLDLQKGSKFAVLAKDTIYTALLLSFFKRKPWRIDPKPQVQKIVKQTLKDDSILKEHVKRWVRDGGKEKEKVDSAFFEWKLLLSFPKEYPWWMDSNCRANSQGWLNLVYMHLILCHDHLPSHKALPFPVLPWISPVKISHLALHTWRSQNDLLPRQ